MVPSRPLPRTQVELHLSLARLGPAARESARTVLKGDNAALFGRTLHERPAAIHRIVWLKVRPPRPHLPSTVQEKLPELPLASPRTRQIGHQNTSPVGLPSRHAPSTAQHRLFVRVRLVGDQSLACARVIGV